MRPLLFVDVDGVLNPYAGACPAGFAAVTLPDGRFDPREKVPAVAAVAGERPLAWVDDMLTTEAWDWAGHRAAPTLLMPIDPAIGLARIDVDALLDWAEAYTRSL